MPCPFNILCMFRFVHYINWPPSLVLHQRQTTVKETKNQCLSMQQILDGRCFSSKWNCLFNIFYFKNHLQSTGKVCVVDLRIRISSQSTTCCSSSKVPATDTGPDKQLQPQHKYPLAFALASAKGIPREEENNGIQSSGVEQAFNRGRHRIAR